MNKRFILVDATCGLVFGDLMAASPTAAARATDQDLGVEPCNYVEEYTSDDLRDAYLVYDATGRDLPRMPGALTLRTAADAAALDFVCTVQRVD